MDSPWTDPGYAAVAPRLQAAVTADLDVDDGQVMQVSVVSVRPTVSQTWSGQRQLSSELMRRCGHAVPIRLPITRPD